MAGPAEQNTSAHSVVRIDLHDGRWREFAVRRADALPFHHPAWAAVLSEVYRHSAFVVAWLDASGSVTGGLPVMEVRRPGGARRWVALPFTDFCPPLGLGSSTPASVVAELDALRRAAGASSFEVRSALTGPGVSAGATSYTHDLTLSQDTDKVFAGFHPSQVQRNIRRATREGVRVRWATDEAGLAGTFYRLHVLTRHRLGVPVQPRRYFRSLWRSMADEGLGFVLIAEIGNVPVASAVFLTHGHTITYKYGASDPRHRGSRANHLLFWEAIKWACGNEFLSFDFGRTGLKDEGLRLFKSRWGATERLLTYSVLADGPVAPPRGEVPEPVRWAIRRSPPIVARAVGEALYRHTA
jgi:CelD/BcsL family acetyltransferase involved in cellulose biosynthesis